MNFSRLFLLSSLTLIFFAANSILCKAALLNSSIDPYSFTAIRVFSAVLILLIVLYISEKKLTLDLKKNWINSLFLFLYAITFSYAYIGLDAGLGALVLFAFVQLSMIIYAFIQKENITKKKTFGIIMAFIGLSYLLYPDSSFELSILHFLLMSLCGISWGVYTILGRKSKKPLIDTSNSFIKSLFFVVILFIFFIDEINISFYGGLLAFISGSLTSAIAYVLWYYLLKNIKIITASVIQLLVPVIAIFLSSLFLDEVVTIKLIISTIIILLGILLSVYEKKTKNI